MTPRWWPRNLSKAARDEILTLLGVSESALPVDAGEDVDGPAELTPFLAKKFMDGVADTTKELLKVFAENNGRASLSQLVARSDYEDWRQLRGFFSGVTRRVRRILNDPDAALLFWDGETEKYDAKDELIDGEYFMSGLTTKR